MRERRVLFFGDSFVAGVGDASGLGFVGRLTASAFGAGLPITAYNLGVRGDTSADVAARWRAEASRRTGDAADNRVLFSFGTNDTEIEGGQPRAAPGASAQSLASCLAGAQASGMPAFVVGPGPVGDGRRLERIEALSASFERICGEFDVPFVRVIHRLVHSTEWVVEAATGDGAHPGAGGYAELARIVSEAGFNYWLRTVRMVPAPLRDDLAQA